MPNIRFPCPLAYFINIKAGKIPKINTPPTPPAKFNAPRKKLGNIIATASGGIKVASTVKTVLSTLNVETIKSLKNPLKPITTLTKEVKIAQKENTMPAIVIIFDFNKLAKGTVAG